MHGRDPTPSLARARNEAHRLLEDLRSHDGARALAALRRLQRLTSLRRRAAAPLEALRRSVRLKHALAVVAAEYGRAPFGHVWTFARRRERLTAEEALERMGAGS